MGGELELGSSTSCCFLLAFMGFLQKSLFVLLVMLLYDMVERRKMYNIHEKLCLKATPTQKCKVIMILLSTYIVYSNDFAVNDTLT